MKRRPDAATESDRNSENQDSVNFLTPVSKHKRPNSNSIPSSSVTSSSSCQDSASTELVSSGKVNPFERHVLANLHRPFWSPSIFPPNAELLETPPQTSWAIDQISKLFPKAIEDSPSTHQNELKLTPSTEAKAQADIERFFSQSCVLPSPVVSSINPNNSTNTLLGAMEICNSPRFKGLASLQRQQNTQFENPAIIVTQAPTRMDSWTSTLLSFPPHLPPHVESVLQPYLRCMDDDSLSSSAVSVAPTLQMDDSDSIKRNSILAPCLSLNTSNNGSNSRRRRLAFSSTDDEDGDENRRCSQLEFSYEEFSPSPMQLSANSLNSPMMMMTPSRTHSSPSSSSYMGKDGFHMRRSENTPCSSSKLCNLQSPNLTPIRRPYNANKPSTAKMLDLTKD